MSLGRREAWFWHGVRGRTPPSDVDSVVAAGSGLSPARRLGIYHSAYFSRQLRVLEETFPRTRAHVAEDRFRELCLAYLERYPSEAPAIELVGARLPDYLATLAGDIRLSQAVLDLARLEWARLESLLAPDAPGAIDPSALVADDVGTRVLVLAPSLRVLRLSRSALDLWEGAPAAEPESGAVAVAIVRRRFAVEHAVLDEVEANALSVAREGGTLDAVSACFPEPGGIERAARALAGWIQKRHVVALVTLLLAVLAGGCGEAESSELPFETGPTMKPGDDCSRCHSEGTEYPTAPVWTAAGTVFPSVDASAAEGVSGVSVLISSADGELLEELVTNSAGNFYTARSLPRGFRVALEHEGARIEMPCPPPAGNCGACHSIPPIGQAAGRIYVPGGGTLDPRPLDCETWMRASP